MKKLSSMVAIAALSAIGSAAAMAQEVDDPFISSQDDDDDGGAFIIDPATGAIVGGTLLGLGFSIFDQDSTSSSTTTTTTP